MGKCQIRISEHKEGAKYVNHEELQHRSLSTLTSISSSGRNDIASTWVCFNNVYSVGMTLQRAYEWLREHPLHLGGI